ncbi:histidine kinase [Chitinophaga sp. 212800010-3]|uniref:sensor histidine kinase n=1 Tax=unclassified Chitinophaga TaxID=2619133 RepID=UPI002DE3D574|nr:GHKL domain-containing protein [Chitinophaga sp. 212800010-3]
MFTIQQLINGKIWKRHLVFTVAVLGMLALWAYLFYAGGFHFNSIGPAVANGLFFMAYIYAGRWLCGRYYLKGQLLPFVVYSLLVAAALLCVDFVTIKYLLGYRHAEFLELLYGSVPFFSAGLITGILLKLIRVSMERELREAKAKAAQKESEFGLLQAQLSPHFLFNVLNNLYGISIDQPERVPQLLLKLSHLLRYSVYGARKTFVPLKDELEYINTYIAFQQIRMSDRLVLKTDTPRIADTGIQIAPLVLIVFVENAFKHAGNTTGQQVYIDLALTLDDNFICMEVTNSYQQNAPVSELPDDNSGVGLANTIKRLNLLYNNNYTLRQYAQHDRYFTELKLSIKYA